MSSEDQTVLPILPPTTKSVKPSNATSAPPAVPQHKYQVNQDLLYEKSFFGHAYISAHLQRLQHGVFTHDHIHTSSTTHVTFAAVTFTVHPSDSLEHRFKSAIIVVKAKNDNDDRPLRFLKFAPHMAHGRISSANMKWNFQLGASLGVTQGPAEATIKPSMGLEKDVVVSSSMKIQGSTRSTQPTLASPKRHSDTVLLWSLEENAQQSAGLPREFTFVFLVERPPPISHAGEPQTPVKTIQNPVASIAQPKSPMKKKRNQQLSLPFYDQGRHGPTLLSENDEETTEKFKFLDLAQFYRRAINSPPPPPLNTTVLVSPVPGSPAAQEREKEKGYMEKLKDSLINAVEEDVALYKNLREVEKKRSDTLRYTDGIAANIHTAETFPPIRFSICVQPNIAGTMDSTLGVEFQDAVVEGQCGQRFVLEEADGCESDAEADVVQSDVAIVTPLLKEIGSGKGELYNFARLPGNFEDLVELPGDSIPTCSSV